MDVLDLQVVVDDEHQDPANWIDALEDGVVPALPQHEPHLLDEPAAERVRLGQDPHGSVLLHRGEQPLGVGRRGIVVRGVWLERYHLRYLSACLEDPQSLSQLLDGPRYVEPQDLWLYGADPRYQLVDGVLEAHRLQLAVDPLDVGDGPLPVWDLLVALHDRQLPLEVRKRALHRSLDVLVVLSGRVHLEQLCPGDARGGNLLEQLDLHGTEPWLCPEAEKQGYLVPVRVAHPVVEQSAVHYVSIVLDVDPVPEPVVADPVEQLVPPLDEDQVPDRVEWLHPLVERLVVDERLEGPVVDDVQLAASDPVLVESEDVLSLLRLGEEADGDEIPHLQFLQCRVDLCLGEGEPLSDRVECPWALGP